MPPRKTGQSCTRSLHETAHTFFSYGISTSLLLYKFAKFMPPLILQRFLGCRLLTTPKIICLALIALMFNVPVFALFSGLVVRNSISGYIFFVYGRPTTKLQCSQKNPVNLLIGIKSVKLPISLEGAGSFYLTYNYYADKEVFVCTIKLNPGENSISVNEPGKYHLFSIGDKYCAGHVKFPTTCQVVQTELPNYALHL
ncbi:hypothetical protein BDF21DRAFT_470394 [Thamnidium elegans]|nr:hypothetical protein BDF21DRAFT_470394 [Thamnidium elegans]